MRWNETCELIRKVRTADDEGVLHQEDVRTQVFCNPFTVGTHTWSAKPELGMSPDAELQIRTCDYSGQRDVHYRDEWFSVEQVVEQGDFCRLVLRRQDSDAEDPLFEEGESGESGESGISGEVESDG